MVRRHLVPVNIDWNLNSIRNIINQGLALGCAVVLQQWLLQGPIILFRHFSKTRHEFGQLVLAIQGLFLLSGVAGAIGRSALPVLSRSIQQKDRKDHLFVLGMLRVGFIFGGVAGILGIGVGQNVVVALFGDQYAGASVLIGYSMWLIIPIISGTALQQILLAKRRTIATIGVNFAGAAAMTMIMPILVKTSGATGTIIAVGIGLMIWMVIQIVLLVLLEKLRIDISVVKTVIMVGCALCIYTFFAPMGGWISIPISMIVLLTSGFGLRTYVREKSLN